MQIIRYYRASAMLQIEVVQGEVDLELVKEREESLRQLEVSFSWLVGWLVDLGLTALGDSISVYIGPSPRERETEERKDSGV